jgi:hypothetical protein
MAAHRTRSPTVVSEVAVNAKNTAEARAMSEGGKRKMLIAEADVHPRVAPSIPEATRQMVIENSRGCSGVGL